MTLLARRQTGVLYFAFLFGVGFALGPICILLVVPHFGTRLAELMDAPIMLGVAAIMPVLVHRR